MRIFRTVGLLILTVNSIQAAERAQAFCETGGQVTVTSGIPSSTQVQASFPQCTVTVFVTGSGGTLATIYADNNGTPLSNPFTANSSGAWFFYAPNGHYDVMLSGSGIPGQFTISDVLLYDPAGPSGTVALCTGSSNDTAAFQALASVTAATQVILPQGAVCTVSANITMPANVTIQMQNGSSLNVGSGYTLTMLGMIQAGTYRIFGGAGSVSFTTNIRQPAVYPEWWNAQGNCTVDDSLAVADAMIAAAGAVQVAFTGCYAHASTWMPPANSNLFCSGPQPYHFLKLATIDDFKLSAAGIQMNGCRLDGQYAGKAYGGYGLNIEASNVHVQNSQINDEYTGMYLGAPTCTQSITGDNIETTTFSGGNTGIMAINVSCGTVDARIHHNVFNDGAQTGLVYDTISVKENNATGTTKNLRIDHNDFNWSTAHDFSVETGNFCVTCTGSGPIWVTNNNFNTNGQTCYGALISYGSHVSGGAVSGNDSGYVPGGCGYTLLEFGNTINYIDIFDNTLYSGQSNDSTSCIDIIGSSYNKIRDNQMYGCNIFIGETNNYGPMFGNIIRGNTINTGNSGTYGIFVQVNYPDTAAVNGTIIDGNILYGNVTSYPTVDAINLEDDGVPGASIVDTRITNNQFYSWRNALRINVTNGEITNVFSCGNAYNNSTMTNPNNTMWSQGESSGGCDSGQEWYTPNSTVVANHVGASVQIPNANVVAGAALGSGGTAAPNSGTTDTDMFGSVKTVSGSSGYGTGTIATITFVNAYQFIPTCWVWSSGTSLSAVSSSLSTTQMVVSGTISSGSATNYFGYICSGY